MALNSSGPMSLAGPTVGQSIQLELGGTGSSTISLNDANVRSLLGVASGTIAFSNAYGKSAGPTAVSYTYTTSTQNASLDITTISGYNAGNSAVTITINGGIYLWSSSTATPGLTLLGGSGSDTVTLVNNGYICGMGGKGGTISAAGSPGGTALKLGINTTVNNTNASAYIGGGGGGGAGFKSTGGGGAGGGAGGDRAAFGIFGGAGGAIGTGGANATLSPYPVSGTDDTGKGSPGGGGGRVFPGTGGAGGATPTTTAKGGTSGGGGGLNYTPNTPSNTGQGFAGGSAASAGSGSSGTSGGGGGGGWGAAGGTAGSFAGGAGGKAVDLNGKTITWTSGNTTRVYGTVA